MTDQLAWYVVQTKRHAERHACIQLGQRAIKSYLPLIVEWPRPAVGSDIQPMFPEYVFVQAVLPTAFHRVAWSPGVRNFVSFGGEPATLDDSHIDFLRSQEGPDGLIRRPDDALTRTRVRITDGPFRGFTALLERRLPARDRVLVLLNILQRETRVELPDRCVGRL